MGWVAEIHLLPLWCGAWVSNSKVNDLFVSSYPFVTPIVSLVDVRVRKKQDSMLAQK